MSAQEVQQSRTCGEVSAGADCGKETPATSPHPGMVFDPYSMDEANDLDDLNYDAPEGYEFVGYWCFRGSGHTCVSACKSDNVPLFAQRGWSAIVAANIAALDVD